MSDTKPTNAELLSEARELNAKLKPWPWSDIVGRLADALERSEEFKSYVHGRLDKMAVPHDPAPDKTQEHGCRIEGRLDYIETRRGESRDEALTLHEGVSNAIIELAELESCMRSSHPTSLASMLSEIRRGLADLNRLSRNAKPTNVCGLCTEEKPCNFESCPDDKSPETP